MKRILVNYATEDYKKTQHINSESALETGNFDDVFEYDPSLIDETFLQEYHNILSSKRGAGYWLWKPYIILDALEEVECGDVVVYADSASVFINSFDPIFDKCVNESRGIVGFQLEDFHKNSRWTKGDCFYNLNVNKYADLPQVMASFIAICKNDFSLDFINQWLSACCVESSITDSENVYQENFSDFEDHRHDQSIFSLLCRKYDAYIYSDITQWGFKSGVILENEQLIYHHRSKLL